MLVAAACEAPVSWTLRSYVLCAALVCLGPVVGRGRRHASRCLVIAGGLGFVSVLALRATAALPAQRTESVIRLPAGEGEPTLGRLLPERDGVILGASALGAAGLATERERDGFVEALDRAYTLYEAREGQVPTPLLATVFGAQRAASFDMLRFSPETAAVSETEVLFLHGAAGNWGLLCWLVAEAAREAGLATTCPSIGASGDWTTPEGLATLAATHQWLKERGVRRIVMLALSQGAASMGAASVALGDDLVAAGALFGYDPAFEPRVPTLVVYATEDERFPSALLNARVDRWVRRGADVTRVAIEGDHFALVKATATTQAAIREWLASVPR
ncbi:MAG: hypothetical protein AAGH15_03210 [Myxococcota bacterium]